MSTPFIVGRYWSAFDNEDLNLDGSEWLYLIVATAIHNRKPHFLAVKCNWINRKPLVDLEFPGAHWFDSTGMGQFHFLAFPQRFDGRRFIGMKP